MPTLVNITTADVKQLATLPGIGPSLAARIIAEREVFPFNTLEDLVRVKGLGEAHIEKLENRAYIGGIEKPVAVEQAEAAKAAVEAFYEGRPEIATTPDELEAVSHRDTEIAVPAPEPTDIETVLAACLGVDLERIRKMPQAEQAEWLHELGLSIEVPVDEPESTEDEDTTMYAAAVEDLAAAVKKEDWLAFQAAAEVVTALSETVTGEKVTVDELVIAGGEALVRARKAHRDELTRQADEAELLKEKHKLEEKLGSATSWSAWLIEARKLEALMPKLDGAFDLQAAIDSLTSWRLLSGMAAAVIDELPELVEVPGKRHAEHAERKAQHDEARGLLVAAQKKWEEVVKDEQARPEPVDARIRAAKAVVKEIHERLAQRARVHRWRGASFCGERFEVRDEQGRTGLRGVIITKRDGRGAVPEPLTFSLGGHLDLAQEEALEAMARTGEIERLRNVLSDGFMEVWGSGAQA